MPALTRLILLALLTALPASAAPFSSPFQKSDLSSIATFIDTFRQTHHRLPNPQEFHDHLNQQSQPGPATPWYYTARPDFLGSWGREGYDYLLGESDTSHVLYYTSWNRRYVSVDQP